MLYAQFRVAFSNMSWYIWGTDRFARMQYYLDTSRNADCSFSISASLWTDK